MIDYNSQEVYRESMPFVLQDSAQTVSMKLAVLFDRALCTRK